MKYIGLYDVNTDPKETALATPALRAKMNYVMDVLKDCDKKGVEVVSPAWSKCGKFKWIKAQKEKLGENITFSKFATFGVTHKIFTPFQWVYSLGQLFFYLLKNVKANSTIVVYHSVYLIFPIALARSFNHFNVVLEVEELYQDVMKLPRFICSAEKKFINGANAYILSAKSLSRYIPKDKPYVVINGTYTIEEQRNVEPFHDGKIHCVYAGTLDQTKGGGAAAAAAAFLPENYHVHILGFGTEQQKLALLNQIKEMQTHCKCTLTFDGLLQGEEYIRFLQRCQIGLCTQVPDAKYTKTSFPSKVLVYLANGLRVVSVRIPSVEQSDIGDLIYYYDKQTPEEIAQVIMNVDLKISFSPQQRIAELNEMTKQKLFNLIETVRAE